MPAHGMCVYGSACVTYGIYIDRSINQSTNQPTHKRTLAPTVARVRDQVADLGAALLLQVAVGPAREGLLLDIHPRALARRVHLLLFL